MLAQAAPFSVISHKDGKAGPALCQGARLQALWKKHLVEEFVQPFYNQVRASLCERLGVHGFEVCIV